MRHFCNYRDTLHFYLLDILADGKAYSAAELPERCAVTVLLTDERNALERAMLHFSHLEKITERLDEKHYRLQLMYNKSDETEMVIRILSFGPLLRVQEPAGFIELLRHRLRKQLALRAKE